MSAWWRATAYRRFITRPHGELRSLARRTREVLLLSAVTGALTGFAVAGFDKVVVNVLLERVLEQSPWVIAFAPLVGLVVAAAGAPLAG